jgi:hypothetical protein
MIPNRPRTNTRCTMLICYTVTSVVLAAARQSHWCRGHCRLAARDMPPPPTFRELLRHLGVPPYFLVQTAGDGRIQRVTSRANSVIRRPIIKIVKNKTSNNHSRFYNWYWYFLSTCQNFRCIIIFGSGKPQVPTSLYLSKLTFKIRDIYTIWAEYHTCRYGPTFIRYIYIFLMLPLGALVIRETLRFTSVS